MSKAIGATEIDEQSEIEIAKNIRELKRNGAALPRQEKATGGARSMISGCCFAR